GRWIMVSGFWVEASEIGKVGLIFFLAFFLEKREKNVNDLKFTLIPISIVMVLLAGLVAIEDLGTSLSLLVVSAILLFVAGLDLRWYVFSTVLAMPAFYLLVYRVKYRYDRILTFVNPDADPLGKGFQMIQSKLAVGGGGFFGLGFMEGKQKLFYLPEAHTDFIFAVIGEEIGLIGTCCVLVLFLLFFWRGIRTAMRAPDRSGF